MPDILAIVGAATGVTALAIQIGTYVRDRPQLEIASQASANMKGQADLAVDVANNGRQPTTLIQAWFLLDLDVEMSNDTKTDLPSVHGKFEMRLDGGEHRLVPPGATTRYLLPLDEWPGPMIQADIPLRPFIVDSRRRRLWGGAAPLLRLLLNKGWEPPAGTARLLLEPLRGPIQVAAVEPRWKIWKSSGLRKSRSYEPEISLRWLEQWNEERARCRDACQPTCATPRRPRLVPRDRPTRRRRYCIVRYASHAKCPLAWLMASDDRRQRQPNVPRAESGVVKGRSS